MKLSVALAAADEAVCWAFAAASEVDEACLTVVALRVKACCDWRRATARETATGISTSDCIEDAKNGQRGAEGPQQEQSSPIDGVVVRSRESALLDRKRSETIRGFARELQEAARDLPC